MVMEDITLIARTSVTVLALMSGVVISKTSILSLFYGMKFTAFDSIMARFYILI